MKSKKIRYDVAFRDFMKRFFVGLYMSFGMFCAVPLPHIWEDNCTGLLMPCFPIVGGVIGAIWWGAAELLVLSGIHTMLAAAIVALLPFIVAGFIHLDGYMDTSDAVLSRRSFEDKVRILKDPHTGAFAVIMLVVMFVLQFAASFAVIENGKYFVLLVVIPIISRCGSAISILCVKPAEFSGYSGLFRQNAGTAHIVFVIFAALAALALSFFFAGVYGVIVAAAVVLGYTAAMACAFGSFKCVSGDLAGFALVISELCGLIALAVLGGRF